MFFNSVHKELITMIHMLYETINKDLYLYFEYTFLYQTLDIVSPYRDYFIYTINMVRVLYRFIKIIEMLISHKFTNQ